MYTLRCTQKLRSRGLKPATGVDRSPDTVLGDWYATLLHSRPQQLVLCVSERSLLPVVLAAKDARSLPQRLAEAVPVMLAEYRKRRDFVVGRLRQIPGVSIVMPKGAFYAYPNISVAYKGGKVKNSLDFANQLVTASHVAVVPGEAFGTNDHVRISYATSMTELERGLDRLHKFIDSVR